jgi:hypothetical protein
VSLRSSFFASWAPWPFVHKALHGTLVDFGQAESFRRWVDWSCEYPDCHSHSCIWGLDVAPCHWEIYAQHFKRVLWFHLHWSNNPRRCGLDLWHLKMKPLCCLDTSGTSYSYWVMRCLIPEKQRFMDWSHISGVNLPHIEWNKYGSSCVGCW